MAGIFQGDCPSGIQFVLCLLPLTWMLKKSKLGYKPRNQAEKISHLMFMDGIKLYGANDHQLESLVNIVKRFSDDIQMNFGIKKCNKITIVRGKVKTTTNIVLENGEEIKSLQKHHMMNNKSDITRLYLPRCK